MIGRRVRLMLFPGELEGWAPPHRQAWRCCVSSRSAGDLGEVLAWLSLRTRLRLQRQVVRCVVAVAALAACLGGCSVSGFAVNPRQESKYDALWLADWRRIAIDLRPLQASASSAGVCNIGGSKQGCYDADVKLIADFRKLGSDLSGAVVPSEFEQANATLHRGIGDEIRGLSDRDHAIASGNPNATLSQSNKELELGQRAWEQALSEFKGVELPANPFT